jgi:hypothetical protein
VDWFGRPTRHEASFRLSLQAGTLLYEFWANKAPQADLSHRPGDFVEGLWEHDVAELFIMAPEGRYQELNLSPCGAWWSATFDEYRKRSAAWRCPSVSTDAGWDDRSWWAKLAINLEDLVVLEGRGLEEAWLNVAAILDPESPEYLCLGAGAQAGEPDFHRNVNFLPVCLMEPTACPGNPRRFTNP